MSAIQLKLRLAKGASVVSLPDPDPTKLFGPLLTRYLNNVLYSNNLILSFDIALERQQKMLTFS